ncbi:MAG: hypothetical protein J6Q13_02180, partial [Clostridia bacterium]|nr:hypothetical protein [Clostridia bacterium]
MKKTFIRANCAWITLNLLFLPALIGGIYLIIDYLVNHSSLEYLIVGILGTVMWSVGLILNNYYRIVVTETLIYCTEDIANTKVQRVQFKEEIKYQDIVKINIVGDTTNSKFKRIETFALKSNVIKKYFEFELIDGSKKRIWIDYYTRKQVIKILMIIIKNIKKFNDNSNLTLDEIM